MTSDRLALHAPAAASAALAAAIALAVAQVAWLLAGAGPAQALLYGASLAAIAFGGTYAGVFFVSLALRARRPKAGLTAGSTGIGAR